MSIAEQIYRRLDLAGLTEPVHYTAASEPWRTALESVEAEIETEMEHLLFIACDSEERQRAFQARKPSESLLTALRRVTK